MTEKNKSRKKSSNSMRGKLLQISERLFVEHGYDGVSIHDVAARAKTTKGHVYYYFKSKDALFDAVMERYFQAEGQALMQSVAGTQGDLRSQIHAALDGYLNFIEQHPGFPRLVQREACSESKRTEKIARNMKPFYAWGESVLKGVFPAEGPRSARHFFLSFFAMALNYYTYAPLLKHLWGENPLDTAAISERREHLHAMLDIVLDNILAKNKMEGNNDTRRNAGRRNAEHPAP